MVDRQMKNGETWYHVDFCHAYAWVYEDEGRLLVRWSIRDGTDLMLRRRGDCSACSDLYRDRHEPMPRQGEFRMDKPPAEFSSAEAFFAVLAELGKWIPGLTDDDPEGGGDG
jgi:hypothetical protein